MCDTDATTHEKVNETDALNQTSFYTVVFHGAVSLQNIVDDSDSNKDTKLLDGLSSIIGDAEVRTVFVRHVKKFHEGFADTRKCIKKRIKKTNKDAVAVLCQRHDFILLHHFFFFFLLCFNYKL